LLPPLEKVWFVGIKDASFLGRCASFRKGLRSGEETNGFPTDLESPRDCTLTETLLVEGTDGFIPTIPIGTARLLIDVHVERASFDAGIAHATRLLELDPLCEDAHRQMMLLRACSSQRSAALAQYDICRRVLADELGVEPEVATTTLYRQIQSDTFVPPTKPPKTSINVPSQLTRFIGREAELAQLEEYLDDPDCRLLTLIGPGGVGKTRLAYEVAKRKAGDFPAGVYAVPLSGLASPQYLASTIAERLTLPLDGSADQKAQLLDALREKHLLLVMDNCEHVLDGMELLAEILAVAPGVNILATSRERLNLEGGLGSL